MRHVADTIQTKSGKVKDGRVARRVTSGRSGELVVTLAPEGIYLREPRRRTAYLLPYGVAFTRAAMLAADAVRREKLAARKAKRAAKGGR
jgi:hypothetical protein